MSLHQPYIILAPHCYFRWLSLELDVLLQFGKLTFALLSCFCTNYPPYIMWLLPVQSWYQFHCLCGCTVKSPSVRHLHPLSPPLSFFFLPGWKWHDDAGGTSKGWVTKQLAQIRLNVWVHAHTHRNKHTACKPSFFIIFLIVYCKPQWFLYTFSKCKAVHHHACFQCCWP